jgi:hypothetical protein
MIIGPLTLEQKSGDGEARHCVRNEIISQQKGLRSSPTLVIGSFFLCKCLFGHLGTYKSEAYLLVDFPLLLVLTKGAKFNP